MLSHVEGARVFLKLQPEVHLMEKREGRGHHTSLGKHAQRCENISQRSHVGTAGRFKNNSNKDYKLVTEEAAPENCLLERSALLPTLNTLEAFSAPTVCLILLTFLEFRINPWKERSRREMIVPRFAVRSGLLSMGLRITEHQLCS